MFNLTNNISKLIKINIGCEVYDLKSWFSVKQLIKSYLMNRKANIKKGGILLSLGYILSPLSWWNDTFINLPIAYFIGILFGLISKRFFLPAMIIGYWLTNITGLMLMHCGTREIFNCGNSQIKVKNTILKNIFISTGYTAVIIILVVFKILKHPI